MKPLSLITKLLTLFKTPNEQIVIDTFIGTGTTAIAAINNNINFIGIEKEQKYVDIANERIKNHKIQGNLFE
jgi:DNA modification methylase